MGKRAGKKQRRLRRERTRRARLQQQRLPAASTPLPATSEPEPIILTYPEHAPALQVEIDPTVSEEVQQLCARYWEIDDEGVWLHRTADLADLSEQTRTLSNMVSTASRAVLLTTSCSGCREPLTATTRSRAIALSGAYHRAPESSLCQNCSTEQEQVRLEQERVTTARAEEEKRRELEGAKRLEEEVEDFLAREATRCLPEGTSWLKESSTPGDTLAVLAGILDYVTAAPTRPIPSLHALEVGWTGDAEADRNALTDLFRAGLLTVNKAAPREAFSKDMQGKMRLAFPAVTWRLPDGTVGGRRVLSEALAYLVQAGGDQPARARIDLNETVLAMESRHVLAYLNTLLTGKYGYPEIPEARLAEATTTIRDGLEGGYTPGQMIAIAWRAADSSAGWKERNARLGPPEASSATVTLLRRKLDDARERRLPVPEYDAPRSLIIPPAVRPGRRLLDAVRRPRLAKNISACERCDQSGWTDVGDTGRVRRCLHPDQMKDLWPALETD